MIIGSPRAPVAIDLAFNADEAATREVFFFDGSISTTERLFEKGKGFRIGRTLRWTQSSQ